MATKSIVSNYLLDAIAQAIAAADGGSSTMQLSEMPARIEAIASGNGVNSPMQTTEMSNQTTASDSGKGDKA